MLESHQIQPGAVDQDKHPLTLVPDDGGEAIHVVDKIQGANGSYLIVQFDGYAALALLPEAHVMEQFSVKDTREPDPELTRLQEENAQLRAQQEPPAPASDPVLDPDPAPPAS